MNYRDLSITAKAKAISWWVFEYDMFNECETIEDVEYSLQEGGFEFDDEGKVIGV